MPEVKIVRIVDIKTHPEPTVTVQETAEYLRCHENTVYKLVREDQLPHMRVGRSIRIVTAGLRDLPIMLRSGERITGQDNDRR